MSLHLSVPTIPIPLHFCFSNYSITLHFDVANNRISIHFDLSNHFSFGQSNDSHCLRRFWQHLFARRPSPRAHLMQKFGHMIDVGYFYHVLKFQHQTRSRSETPGKKTDVSQRFGRAFLKHKCYTVYQAFQQGNPPLYYKIIFHRQVPWT